MSKLRLCYIFSLVVLGALLVSVFWSLPQKTEKYTEVSRESVIQQQDEWILQFDIINREGKDITYTINCRTGEGTSTKKVLVKDGRTYTHIHHVYRETVKEDEVTHIIYKEGEATPFEEATNYVRFD